jgi:hypothetical protein
VYAEVEVRNDSQLPLEVHKSPSSISLLNLSSSKAKSDVRTGTGEGQIEGASITFVADQSVVLLRPGEGFIKKLDLTGRFKAKPARYSVTACWDNDKGLPQAKQPAVDLK